MYGIHRLHPLLGTRSLPHPNHPDRWMMCDTEGSCNHAPGRPLRVPSHTSPAFEDAHYSYFDWADPKFALWTSQ